MKIETTLDGAVVTAIERHYRHAKKRHPHFCDELLSNAMSARAVDALLKEVRADIERDAGRGRVAATDVLDCEICEMESAIAWGDNAHAVEEAYDCIAVLLRVVDVLEGRQASSGPKEGGVK